MGTVFRATQLALQREVAIKLLRAPDPTHHARLQREALALAALQHRAIVAVHDFGETRSGEPFLVMELVRGVSLEAHLVREGSLPPPSPITCARSGSGRSPSTTRTRARASSRSTWSGAPSRRPCGGRAGPRASSRAHCSPGASAGSSRPSRTDGSSGARWRASGAAPIAAPTSWSRTSVGPPSTRRSLRAPAASPRSARRCAPPRRGRRRERRDAADGRPALRALARSARSPRRAVARRRPVGRPRARPGHPRRGAVPRAALKARQSASSNTRHWRSADSSGSDSSDHHRTGRNPTAR